jgi:hypothetical protein
MATKAEEYRSKTAECDQRVASARDPDAKAQYRELARHWRELGPTGRPNGQIKNWR